MLNNSKCVSCGISAKCLLAIHHIDGNKNNNNISNHEILCANCHILRHLKEINGEWVYYTKALTPRYLLSALYEQCSIVHKDVYIPKECFKVKDYNKEYLNENFKIGLKRIKRNTAYFNNLLNSSKCVSCGILDKYLLVIHHIDGNKNNNNMSNHEILCANCHILRHLKGRKKDGELVHHTKTLTPRYLLDELFNKFGIPIVNI